jgi:hypothetical protein
MIADPQTAEQFLDYLPPGAPVGVFGPRDAPEWILAGAGKIGGRIASRHRLLVSGGARGVDHRAVIAAKSITVGETVKIFRPLETEHPIAGLLARTGRALDFIAEREGGVVLFVPRKQLSANKGGSRHTLIQTRKRQLPLLLFVYDGETLADRYLNTSFFHRDGFNECWSVKKSTPEAVSDPFEPKKCPECGNPAVSKGKDIVCAFCLRKIAVL